jgi:hypothetical protein
MLRLVLQVSSACVAEVSKPDGCECTSLACLQAVQKFANEGCREALTQVLCKAAGQVQNDTGINLRDTVLHIVNDCANGARYSCPEVCTLEPCPLFYRTAIKFEYLLAITAIIVLA